MTKKSDTPAIRFKGFTDTWEQRKFSDVVATRRGLTYKPSDIRKNGVRVLRSSNIAEDSFVLSDEDVFVVREAVNIDCVRANDILITAANGSSRLVGKHTIISGIPEESAVHGGFMLLGTTKEPHFVNASMGSSWYRRFIELFVAGGNGAIGNLNKNDLDNQDIAIPSEKEQKKIGSFFRQLDNLITLHQRKYDKLTNVKKSMLEKMFPKNGSNVPEIRFKGFTEAWEQRKLDELVDVCSGRDYKHLSEGTIPVYGTGGYMLSVNDALSYDRDAIGIGRKGTIDRPYILKAPFWTVDTLFYAIPREKVDLNFAFDIFQNIDWKKKDESTGVPSLSKTAINDIDVLAPKHDEQQTIGQFFAALDDLITLHQRELEKLKNIKKSCLENMFV